MAKPESVCAGCTTEGLCAAYGCRASVLHGMFGADSSANISRNIARLQELKSQGVANDQLLEALRRDG